MYKVLDHEIISVYFLGNAVILTTEIQHVQLFTVFVKIQTNNKNINNGNNNDIMLLRVTQNLCNVLDDPVVCEWRYSSLCAVII